MAIQMCASKLASWKYDVPALAWPGKGCLCLVSSIPKKPSWFAQIHCGQFCCNGKSEGHMAVYNTTTALQFALSNVSTPGAWCTNSCCIWSRAQSLWLLTETLCSWNITMSALRCKCYPVTDVPTHIYYNKLSIAEGWCGDYMNQYIYTDQYISINILINISTLASLWPSAKTQSVSVSTKCQLSCSLFGSGCT